MIQLELFDLDNTPVGIKAYHHTITYRKGYYFVEAIILETEDELSVSSANIYNNWGEVVPGEISEITPEEIIREYEIQQEMKAI